MSKRDNKLKAVCTSQKESKNKWLHIKIGEGGEGLGKKSGGMILIKDERDETPEKYRKLNEIASLTTGNEIYFRNEILDEKGYFDLDLVSDSNYIENYEIECIAREILNEFKYLTEDAFCLQKQPITREILYEVLDQLSSDYSAKLMAHESKSYIGGLVNKYKSVDCSNKRYVKTGKLYSDLIKSGNTRKQALFILAERFGSSTKTIERDLKKFKESTDKS